jgi:hypothetical protein
MNMTYEKALDAARLSREDMVKNGWDVPESIIPKVADAFFSAESTHSAISRGLEILDLCKKASA